MRDDHFPVCPKAPVLCLALACQLVGIPAFIVAVGLIIDGLTNSHRWATWTEGMLHLHTSGAKLGVGLAMLVAAISTFRLPGYREVVRFISWRRNQERLEKLYSTMASPHSAREDDR